MTKLKLEIARKKDTHVVRQYMYKLMAEEFEAAHESQTKTKHESQAQVIKFRNPDKREIINTNPHKDSRLNK